MDTVKSDTDNQFDIMIVDDNPKNLKLLSDVLAKSQYTVRLAADADIALQNIKAKIPSLILLDVGLPGMNGYDMCRLLKQEESTKSIPVIFLTDHNSPEDKRKGFEAGAVDFIVKPLFLVEVLARVNTHISNRKLQLELEKSIVDLKNEKEEHKRLKEKLTQSNETINTFLEKEKLNRKALLSILHDQKETMATLEESKLKLLSVLNATPFPVALVDSEGDKINFWSKSATTLFGHTALTTLEWYKKAYPDPAYRNAVITRWKQMLKKARKSGKPVNTGEYQITCRDGSTRVCELYATFMAENIIVTFNDITERKQAEEALQESESRFKSLVENTVVGMYRTSVEGEIVMANPRLISMLGFSLFEELNERNLEDVGYALDSAREHFKKLMEKDGKVLGYESAWHTKDGKTIWVIESARSIKDENGIIRYYEGTVEDITERKRAGDRLRESKQMLEGIINLIPARVFWKDKNLVYQGCNAIFAHDAGFTDPQEIIGKDDFQMGWSNQAELYRSDDRQVIESGASKLLIEEEQTTPEGKTITLLTSKIPLPNSRGEISGVLGTYLDITERKQAEAKTRESEEKYRSIFEESKDVIFISTPDGKFIDINPAGVELFKYASKELLLKADFNNDFFLKPDDQETYRRILEDEGSIKDYEFPLKDSEGNKLIIAVTASLIHDQSGKTIAYRGIMRDMTAHKQLEEQLQQSQKLEAIGQLAGGIAHDFNNLLTVINGYSSILLTELESDGKLYKQIEQIAKAGDRAGSLTKQLLAFSRKQIIQPTILELNFIIEDVQKILNRLIGEDIQLITNLTDRPGFIKADAGQMNQIIMNLAVNARDAMPDGGIITIETSPVDVDANHSAKHLHLTPGAYVVLSFSDNGKGMNKETQKHIFEPFFTTKPEGRGTGQGLSTVYGIVKQHNGHIWVYSEPGLGTTFKIYFPQVDNEPELNRVSANEDKKLKGTETILLVEDDPDVLMLTTEILQAAGYKVIETSGGEQAIAAIKKYKDEVALLITDVIMPGLSGKKLSDKIKKYRPDIRVIFISGYTGDAIARLGIIEKGMLFLQKPFMPLALHKIVREALDSGNK